MQSQKDYLRSRNQNTFNDLSLFMKYITIFEIAYYQIFTKNMVHGILTIKTFLKKDSWTL